LLTLSRHFHFSIDKLLRSDSELVINLPTLSNTIKSEKDYILGLLRHVEAAANDGTEIFYITSELPIFYYLRYPELGLFKLFIYGRTVWETEQAQGQFSSDLYDMNYYHSLFAEMMYKFDQMPTTEIWGNSVVKNTLNQICYYTESGVFKDIDCPLLICSQLKSVMQQLQNFAKCGIKKQANRKNEETEFNLYHNEIAHTNNTVILKGKSSKSLFCTYDNPNFFFCRDEKFWDYSYDMFIKLKRRSIAISKDAEKSRMTVFNRIYRQIDKTEEFVKARFPH